MANIRDQSPTLAGIVGRAACLLALMILSACGADAPELPPEPETIGMNQRIHVFDSDLGGWAWNTGRWYNYVLADLPCESGIDLAASLFSPSACFQWISPEVGAAGDWVSSVGPWWIDPNHMTLPGGTGFGFINVVAFAQIPAATRSPANLDRSVISFEARVSQDFSTNTVLTADGERKGHVYLWFQTSPRKITPCTPDPLVGEDCTRQSDYILTGDGSPSFEIDRIPADEVKRFTFAAKASDASQWTCLGRGSSVKYDCIDFAEALRTASVIGFVIAPTRPCPTWVNEAGTQVCDAQTMLAAPNEHLNFGTFQVKAFSITKEATRPTTATRVALPAALSDPEIADDRWSTPKMGVARTFVAGSGVHFPIDTEFKALRVGLSSEVTPDSIDEAGYQLYIAPAGTDRDQPENNLMVVTKGESGAFDRANVIGRYRVGDTLGMFFEEDRLVFLKNDEVIMEAPSPCSPAPSCSLRPFYAAFGLPTAIPRIFAY